MTCVAVCAVSMALLVQAAFIAIIIGPLIASVLEVRKGGNGLTAGMVGGTITWVGVGAFSLIWECYTHPAIQITADEIGWVLIVFAAYTIGGGVIGLAEAIASYFVRYLLTLPKRIRLRAERSAKANIYGSTTAAR
jgi:hypothetical protein